MKRLLHKGIWLMVLGLFFMPITLSAASSTEGMAQYPNVSISPDGSGRAWTTDLLDQTDERLPFGYTVDLKQPSSIRDLHAGEHYYQKKAEGSVPVGRWEVNHTPGQCIHDTATRDTFAGFTYTNQICRTFYNNGWFAYCADCGEKIAHMLIYARESTVSQIKSLPASSVYVYLCPHCSHLEQGSSYQHYCKGISANRYRVTYRPNAPEGSNPSGYMAPTMHMYGDQDTYNGEPASEIGYTDTSLRKNSFLCEGYVFIGWNTEPDGSGTSFSDGQEVRNLTTRDNGTVKLYAQWESAESTLRIDAGGGTYNGQAVYQRTQKYLATYPLDTSLLVPPKGYQVSFVSNGGSAVNPITTTKSFLQWEKPQQMYGSLKGEVYHFTGMDGAVDTLKATYLDNGFVLPECQAANASLVGWYADPGFSEGSFVGKPGETTVVNQDTVLYARWAVLTLWATDDYASHGGVGAVDLTWEQKDGKSKYYRLYQSLDGSTWKDIFGGADIGSSVSIQKTYGTGNQGSTYQIPYTGNYTLSAAGAKGADYSTTLKGGAGATVSATYWLKKGDVLTFYAGSAGDGVNGGSNGHLGAGGGSSVSVGRGGGAASEVYLTRNGSTSLLLSAGGGGGANAVYAGGAGNAQSGSGSVSAGAAGNGGGGGGSLGGSAGTYVAGTESVSIQTLTNTTLYIPYSYHSYEVSPYALSNTGTEVINGATYYKFTEKNLGTIYSTRSAVNLKPDYNAVSVSGSYVVLSYVRTCSSGNCLASGYGYHHTLDGICNATIPFYRKIVTTTAPVYSASSGGGSYINPSFGCKNTGRASGSNAGDGYVTLGSLDVGYLEALALNDVLAKDMAAPGVISSYRETLIREGVCRIQVAEPMDYGTAYYHKAESYSEDGQSFLSASNVTKDILTSGVAGYRYYVDTLPTGTVTATHPFTAGVQVDVTMTDTQKYLHIAAVDVAGNLGPTKHILIKTKDKAPEIETDETYPEQAPLRTRQLTLATTDFVYEAEPDVFYVRADGETEHTLQIGGYVDGTATKDYQVDWLRLLLNASDIMEWYQVRIPKTAPASEAQTFENPRLSSDASEEELELLTPTSATGKCYAGAAEVTVDQRFTIHPERDGMAAVVYPKAISEFQETLRYSDDGSDKTNGLTMIPDGEAPAIYGVEELEVAGNIDMTQVSKDFVIRAEDTGSGMKQLSVTIVNQDNQMQRTYHSDTGEVTITVDKEDYLFLGDFIAGAEAVDLVGNVSQAGCVNLAFTLQASLQRARSPHNGIFKAGDGAILTVTAGGYADKVSIRFPEELTNLNPDLDKEYVYALPEAVKTEVYAFSIPLETRDGIYTVLVEAWKDGRKLTEDLQLPVTLQGSITEELRTRIRDNGV